MTFPLSPVPSHYTRVNWKQAGRKRNGIHYVGDTVTLTLDASGPDAYEVRDYFGNVVASGSMSGTTLNLGSSWDPGWYRVYFTGPTNDAVFGYSYAATNFVVFRDDPHFPANPDGSVSGSTSVAEDYITKGIIGGGTSRMAIANMANVATELANMETDLATTLTYWVDPGSPYADAERPRYAWLAFSGGSVDKVQIMAGSGVYHWGDIYCKDETIDGSEVFVEVSAGTNPSTWKLEVFSPDSVTLVETWDNLSPSGSTAQATVSASDYVLLKFSNQGAVPDPISNTAIGRDYWNGVKTVVETLYPQGCEFFEGPSNEPEPNSQDRTLIPYEMFLFSEAVHAGNANAKAIGCEFVTITWPDTRGWYGFFNNSGGTYADEISVHAYNSMTNGDINLGKAQFGAFQDLMTSFSVSKPLWQTESTWVMTPVYGVYHPRRARVLMLQTILMEQYGFVKEKNNSWYELSHGYWAVPAWLVNGDGSLNPPAALMRVLAEEIWGKPYDSALDFGTPGNNIFVGNVYTNAAGASTIALMSTCYMDNAVVHLQISGTSDAITLVDGFGNESAVAQSNGVISITLTEIPTYVRLPVGVSASVYACNDWGPGGLSASHSPSATTKKINSTTYTEIGDDAFMTSYGNTSVGIAPPSTYVTTPATADLLWDTSVDVGRVIVWCGPSWQTSGTLIDFDVQTTTDGTNWTTQKTVTKTGNTSFPFGTDANNAGCSVETYWDEQWVFDVPLDTVVSCTGVRLNIREASYGGEPDADAYAAGGQGAAEEAFKIQEIGVYPDAAVIPSEVHFGRRTTLSDTPTVIYTAPADAVATIRHIHVSNPSASPVTFTLSINTDATSHRVFDAFPVKAHRTKDHHCRLSLAAGETVEAFAGTADTLVLAVNGLVRST